MTMELSGLPPKTATSLTTLQAARDGYKSFFGTNLPDAYDKSPGRQTGKKQSSA